MVRLPRRRVRWGHRCIEAEDDPRADGGSVAASRRGRDARALDDVDAGQMERGNTEGLEVAEEAGGAVEGVGEGEALAGGFIAQMLGLHGGASASVTLILMVGATWRASKAAGR